MSAIGRKRTLGNKQFQQLNMTNTYYVETSEVYQLKRTLERVKAELDMYKCYKTSHEARIGRLKEARRKAHLPFKGVIE